MIDLAVIDLAVITAFQFQFMAIAIDPVDGCGSSNIRRQLQPKKTKFTLCYIPVN